MQSSANWNGRKTKTKDINRKQNPQVSPFGISYTEIGKKFGGVSREMVRVILLRALYKIQLNGSLRIHYEQYLTGKIPKLNKCDKCGEVHIKCAIAVCRSDRYIGDLCEYCESDRIKFVDSDGVTIPQDLFIRMINDDHYTRKPMPI